jgi:two-component system response regulator FixJ
VGEQAKGTHDAQKLAIHQRLATLTATESRVLESLVDGRPNKTIAHDLGLTAHMVEVHRASVMTKMQSASLSQLVRMTLLAAH